MGKFNIDNFCIDDIFDEMKNLVDKVSSKEKKKKDKKSRKKAEKDGSMVIEINV